LFSESVLFFSWTSRPISQFCDCGSEIQHNPMPNFFITDKNGKKHSFTEQQLQELAAKGRITPNTPLETDTGHKGHAGQIHGLKFNTAAPNPCTAAMPTASQTTPHSVDESANKGSRASLWITIGGAVLILIVVGIAWSIISKSGGGRFPVADKDITTAKKDFHYVYNFANRGGNINSIIDKWQENFSSWKRAAEKGSPEGQILLGISYSEGIWVPQDRAEGAIWLKMAAEQGNAEGMFRLAIYDHSPDTTTKIRWLQNAARLGHEEAKELLQIYEK
jgi:hypothetical protein